MKKARLETIKASFVPYPDHPGDHRVNKAYQHRLSEGVVVVTGTTRMSAGTFRHRVLVLDGGSTDRRPGDVLEIDEVPVTPWQIYWIELG